jgi:competence protein ComEA
MNSLSDLLVKISQVSKKRALIAVFAIAAIFGIWFSNSQAPQAEFEQAAEVEIFSPSTFLVHVAGAVSEPGLYELDSGARVSDAVEKAGGFTASALESSVNLARMIADGEQIVVLDSTQLEADSGYVSLNSASASKLEELPGIGPSTAKKIIAYRQEIGSFSSIEQIVEVPGIGEKLLEQIRDQLTL